MADITLKDICEFAHNNYDFICKVRRLHGSVRYKQKVSRIIDTNYFIEYMIRDVVDLYTKDRDVANAFLAEFKKVAMDNLIASFGGKDALPGL